jgi:hypothetical protein
MIDGVRVACLDELLGRLDHIAEAWDGDPQLQKISFLVRRATGDFEAALEAGLSGYPSLAIDAMRDVMEIELLLLDFYVEPTNIDGWLTADRPTRMKVFPPRELRARLIKLGLHEVVGTAHVTADYHAHSESLHVNPTSPALPFLRKGHVPENDLVSLDASFVEIFEHGRRLGNAMLLVAHRVSPDGPAEEACRGPLPKFGLAHERTQEFFKQFLDLLKAELPPPEDETGASSD